MKVALVVGGEVVNAALPQVYEAAAAALPLITKLYGGGKRAVLSSLDLHKQLGGSYRYNTWVENLIKDYDFVEGEDFWRETLEATKDNMRAIANNRGSVVWFSTKAASYIVVKSKSEQSKKLFDYLHAVAELVTPVLLARMNDLKLELKDSNEQKERFAETSATLARTLPGVTHGAQADNIVQKAKRYPEAVAKADAANSAAFQLLECLTTVKQALQNGNTKRAQTELSYVEESFGVYHDKLRDAPPWYA